MLRRPKFRFLESELPDNRIKIMVYEQSCDVFAARYVYDKIAKKIIKAENRWYDDYPDELVHAYLEDEYAMS